jgi:pimeloyl-ACP methyl ester carboxylesterase
VSLICGIGPPDIGMSGAGWPTYLGFTAGWRYANSKITQILLRWFFQRDNADSLELSDEERLRLFLSPDRTKGMSDADKAFFGDEDEMRAYLATSRASYQQGFDAMCKDGYAMCTEWGFRIEDIRKDLPVVLWYGSQDKNVPPNHGRTIAQRLRMESERGDGEVKDGGPVAWKERVRLRMLDDTHASISMRDKKGYLMDILNAWGC